MTPFDDCPGLSSSLIVPNIKSYSSVTSWMSTPPSPTPPVAECIPAAPEEIGLLQLELQIEKLALKHAKEDLQAAKAEIEVLKATNRRLCNDATDRNKELHNARKLAAERLIAAENWESSAREYSGGLAYYRELVKEIGSVFGLEAQIADDGNDMGSVLCAKVPELVRLAVWRLQQYQITKETPDDERNARQRVITIDPAD